MTKRMLVLVIVGILLVGGAAAVIASSVGGSDDEPVHTLQGGQTHTGDLPPGGHTMDDGAMMNDDQMPGR